MGAIKMSSAQKKQSVTATQLFSEFTEACKEHFAFLETDFGLSLRGPEHYGREFAVIYANANYKITIFFEYPGPPWIAIEKKEGNRWKRKGLHQLFKLVFNKDLPNTGGRNDGSDSAHDLSNLPLLSDILKLHWDKLVSVF